MTLAVASEGVGLVRGGAAVPAGRAVSSATSVRAPWGGRTSQGSGRSQPASLSLSGLVIGHKTGDL